MKTDRIIRITMNTMITIISSTIIIMIATIIISSIITVTIVATINTIISIIIFVISCEVLHVALAGQDDAADVVHLALVVAEEVLQLKR